MADTTTNFQLYLWDNGSDLYDHNDLVFNFETLDAVILPNTGGRATGPIIVEIPQPTDEAFAAELHSDPNRRSKITGESISFGDGTNIQNISIGRDVTTGEGFLRGGFRAEFDSGPEITFSDDSSVGARGEKLANSVYIDNVVPSEAVRRFAIYGDGRFSWGPGNGPLDTHLYRSGVGELTLEDDLKLRKLFMDGDLEIGDVTLSDDNGTLIVTQGFATPGTITARLGHTGRIRLGNPLDTSQSIVQFGSAADVSLYKDGTNLRTDNNFTPASIVSGPIQASSFTVTGTSTFSGAVTVSASLTANSTSVQSLNVRGGGITADTATVSFGKPIQSSKVSSTGTIEATGKTWANGGLEVTGSTKFNSTVNANQIDATGVTITTGDLVLNGGSQLYANSGIHTNGLSVTGDIYVTGAVYSPYLRSSSGTITVQNNMTSSGTLRTNGYLDVAGNLGLNGGSILNGGDIYATRLIRSAGNNGAIQTSSLVCIGETPQRSFDVNGGVFKGGGLNTGGASIYLGGSGSIYAANIIQVTGKIMPTNLGGMLQIDGGINTGTIWGQDITANGSFYGRLDTSGQGIITWGGNINLRNNPSVAGASGTLIGTVTAPSDRDIKTDFNDVDEEALLDGISKLNVQSWRYTGDDSDRVPHVGPTAQDFFEAFGGYGVVKHEDLGLDLLDMIGILYKIVGAQSRKIKALELGAV